MNASPTYLMRWRGVESGPFPQGVIERMLDEGQICLWHEVSVNGQWMSVEDLFKATVPSKPVPETKARAAVPVASPVDAAPKAGPRTLPRLHDRKPGGS